MEVILHLFMVYTLMYDPFHTPSAGGDSEGFQKKYEKAEKKKTQPGTINLNYKPPTTNLNHLLNHKRYLKVKIDGTDTKR